MSIDKVIICICVCTREKESAHRAHITTLKKHFRITTQILRTAETFAESP